MGGAEPASGAFHGREHRLPVRVYYEDTDFTGVVYHANYLRYFERGRSDYLRTAGISHRALLERADPCAFTVTSIAVDFRQAARIDDALTVVTAYEAMAGARVVVRQKLERDADLIAEARVEVACITPQGRARRPPADLVERLRPLLTQGAP
ncbi:MAG: tol-pal system-associated acyl-CoA thioesterase [Caulobacterales bacterium]